jgi:hypothetical protein
MGGPMERKPQDGFSAFDFGALTRALDQAGTLARQLQEAGLLTSDVVDMLAKVLAATEQQQKRFLDQRGLTPQQPSC